MKSNPEDSAPVGDSPLLPRKLALGILLRFERNGKNIRQKADALIQQAIASEGRLSPRDSGFVYALVIGVLRDWHRLDAWIALLSGRPIERLRPTVRVLLRMGLLQLSGGIHSSPYAAIHTTVELARIRKESEKTLKFINAVLREAQRRLEKGGFSDPPPVEANFPGHMLLQYGWPNALTDLIAPSSSPPEAEALIAMARATREPAPLAIRVNTLAIGLDAYQALLTEAGLEVERVDSELPEGLTIRNATGSPAHLPGYADGLFYVQDFSSIRVTHRLAPQPGESILDLCAAPGSKTTHMAALMGNQGQITAIEPRRERVKILKDNLSRLHVRNVTVLEMDALEFSPEAGLYDRVLVDAPCSGSGTLRRHPEIALYLSRPNFSRTELPAYTRHQQALLQKGYDCLKPGGLLIYSTCSILPAENQEVIRAFLAANPDARLEDEEQRPIMQDADGFYIARIVRTAP